VDLNTGEREDVAPRPRNSKVYRIRYHVAEVEQVKCAFMGDDGYIFPHCEPRSEHVLTRRRRVITKAIESPTYSDEPAALHVMRGK
jgi:Cu2+-containing amine oxidase